MAVLKSEIKRFRRFVVMSDYVHLRIYIRPGAKDPLVQVGRFVQNFKR